jgi:ADP-heptose:LPS heptosyltransferase
LDRFVEVGLALKARGIKVLVSGSRGEHGLCETLANACGGRNISGKTSLPALAEVIRHALLVLGNDSAGMHIAVATGTNSLCVMWGGSFGRFIPYESKLLTEGQFAKAVYHRMDCFGCTGVCPLPPVHSKLPCIAAVSVSAVLVFLEEFLHNNCISAINNPHSVETGRNPHKKVG